MLSIFSCLLAAGMSSLGRCLFRSFSHLLIGLFIFLVLSCMSCLYNLEINPLSLVSFAIIFSNSEGCLFTLCVVSFALQKLLSLIKSFFIFCFYFHYSRRWIIEDLALCQMFCLCLPLRVLWFLLLRLHFNPF